MASANISSSPRDHAADANPDRARKKQRLSDGASTPPANMIVDDGTPADIGTDICNVIPIENDIGAMELYSDNFNPQSAHGTPEAQLDDLQRMLDQNYYIRADTFVSVVDWLTVHIQKTADEPSEYWQHYFELEETFFTKFAYVAAALLDGGDLFDPTLDINNDMMCGRFVQLLENLTTICNRIISLIPEALKSTLSRRDSAQTASRQHSLGALSYIPVAVRVLSLDTPTSQVFYHQTGFILKDIIIHNRGLFFSDHVTAALATVISTVSNAVREVRDSWTILHSSLKLMNMTIGDRRRMENYPKAEVESVMEASSTLILPAICEKHPRALPENFHAIVFAFMEQALRTHAHCYDRESAFRLYDHFVKDERDALLLDAADNSDPHVALWSLANEDQAVLVRLLTISWVMQAANTFLRSGVMDVRNVGLTALADQLKRLYNYQKSTLQSFEHPTVQYAVRYLRKNEVTRYIFGAESHANIVSNSGEVICFLAATSTYSNVETDIIWRACSTSVEADFVQAAFGILEQLLPHLQFAQLIYLAKKYSSTSVEKLGMDAVAFLSKLLKTLEEKSVNLLNQADRLAAAFISIDILKQIKHSTPSTTSVALRFVAMTEISRFAVPEFTSEHRMEIYKRCIPEVTDGSGDSTTALEIMRIFLHMRLSSHEACNILSMLPISAAVDELCDFVQARKQQPIEDSDLLDVSVRLDCIARLMALDGVAMSGIIRRRLFALAFGESALCNAARDAAWDRLCLLASTETSARDMLENYMEQEVPSLAADHATPRLIEIVSKTVEFRCSQEGVRSDFTQLLKLPLWTTLYRFATASPNSTVVKMATDVISNLLFMYPDAVNIPRVSTVQCHCAFIRGIVKDLRRDYEELPRSDDEDDSRELFQRLDLLYSVFIKSKETTSLSSPEMGAEVVIVDEPANGADQLIFTAEVYGLEKHPKVLKIQAFESTKVSTLLAHLPERTGADVNRIIFGGQEISRDVKKSLSEVGVRQSGVIMIRPKYTFSLSIDKRLTCSGPVEQEILAQYDSLESFVDGPYPFAHKAYSFLESLRPSPEARIRVTSPEISAQELFPPKKTWRSMFSIHVLRCHLDDFTRLGVVDTTFIRRAIRLLTEYIFDETRPLEPDLMINICTCLLKFLQERSESSKSSEFLDDPDRFLTRLVNLIYRAKQQCTNYITDRANASVYDELTLAVFRILIESTRNDASLLKIFSEKSEIFQLHQQLLLDDNTDLSLQLTDMMRNRCREGYPSLSVSDYYWRAIYAALPEALAHSPRSNNYFELAMDVLSVNQVIYASETNIRDLIHNLTGQLLSFRHRESSNLFMMDVAMAGLLRLIGTAIRILKSYKKPLELESLSTYIFCHLLFPTSEGSECHPLIHKDTRTLAYDLVQLTFGPEAKLEEFVDTIREAIRVTGNGPNVEFPGHAIWTRPADNCAGLRNLGMTCYMNSLLQQLFANLHFRKFVFDQPTMDTKEQDLLGQVQLLFGRMQEAAVPTVEPGALAQALDVQIGSQEDVHGFYAILLSKLEESMPDAKRKEALGRFFTGKSVTQIRGECGHVSTRQEPFSDLSITVKNKTSLHDSLAEFVQGEPMEGANKYKCLTCGSDSEGRLVNAMRRTCLEEIPDNLTFCLKRFTFDAFGLEGENKVNDCFKFPEQIDMSPYKRVHLESPNAPIEPDTFELVGVIVHQGSLTFGHYWSYVRISDVSTPDMHTWVCIEDTNVRACPGGVQEVQEQCFGGLKYANGNDRVDNAYVLFYQRKEHIHDARSVAVSLGFSEVRNVIPPRVPLPRRLEKIIYNENLWHHKVGFLFDDRFSSFYIYLINEYRRVSELKGINVTLRSTSESTTEYDDSSANEELEAKISDMAVGYILKILVADPSCTNKAAPLLSSIADLSAASPALTSQLLRRFSLDEYGFKSIFLSEHSEFRAQLSRFFEICLSTIREQDPDEFAEILPMVLAAHSSLLGRTLDTMYQQWHEYFAFPAFVAGLGPFEVELVLDTQYLQWAVDALQVRYSEKLRKKHPHLWTAVLKNKVEFSPLFNFVRSVLNEHVDLSEDFECLASHGETRTRTAYGICLRQNEMENLFDQRTFKKGVVPVWTLFLAGSQGCTDYRSWKDYAPGKLLGQLLNKPLNPQLSTILHHSLATLYDHEDDHLEPVLYNTLHFCSNTADRECQELLRTLGSNLPLWKSLEQESLWFLREAYSFSPTAVIESVPAWAKDFLLTKNPNSRQATVTWLFDHLFNPAPLSDNTQLDVARVRSTRTLVGQGRPILRDAYETEQSRGRYESMVDALKGAENFLIRLQTEMSKQKDKGSQKLGREMLVEYDESRATFSGLRRHLIELMDWESDPSLPTRPAQLTESIEAESDEAGSSDADEVSNEDCCES